MEFWIQQAHRGAPVPVLATARDPPAHWRQASTRSCSNCCGRPCEPARAGEGGLLDSARAAADVSGQEAVRSGRPRTRRRVGDRRDRPHRAVAVRDRSGARDASADSTTSRSPRPSCARISTSRPGSSCATTTRTGCCRAPARWPKTASSRWRPTPLSSTPSCSASTRRSAAELRFREHPDAAPAARRSASSGPARTRRRDVRRRHPAAFTPGPLQQPLAATAPPDGGGGERRSRDRLPHAAVPPLPAHAGLPRPGGAGGDSRTGRRRRLLDRGCCRPSRGGSRPTSSSSGSTSNPHLGRRHWVVLEEPPHGYQFFSTVPPNSGMGRAAHRRFHGTAPNSRHGAAFADAAFADPYRVMIRGAALLPVGV